LKQALGVASVCAPLGVGGVSRDGWWDLAARRGHLAEALLVERVGNKADQVV
jgi:hypothetical protein